MNYRQKIEEVSKVLDIYSEEELTETIDKLKQVVITNGKCANGSPHGVCGELGIHLPPSVLTTWDYFSGNVWYPVNDPKSSLTPKQQFIGETNLWEGNQLIFRLNLCGHLLILFNTALERVRKSNEECEIC